MNNCFIDFQDENIDWNIWYSKNRYNSFWKGNCIVDEYNRKKMKEEEEFDVKFAKKKNKIKLVVFRDGFIVYNGPFGDTSLRENYKNE